MKLNNLLFFSICIFFISSVSANLVITPINITTDKYAETDKQISFQIYNNDAYTYYNISSSSNDLVLPTISSLSSGQTANVTALLKTDVSGDYNYKIKGLYYTTIGNSNTTHILNITNYNGISPCDFSIIQGDTIKWQSLVNNVVVIKNTDTNTQIASLNLNETYTFNTVSPLILNYGLYVGGFLFTSCKITVLDGNGYVNDPSNDGSLNTKINVIFNPTSVTANVSVNNYTIPVTQTQDGVLTLNNTGNQTAYKVHLEGSSWLSFTSNDFNLLPGQSKPIIYTITPLIYSTNDTNKTYSVNLGITGNFNTINQSILVTIPYEDISNLNINTSNFTQLLSSFCLLYPYSPFCNGTQQVVYKYINNASDEPFNVTLTRNQVNQLWLYMISQTDSITTATNYIKESRATDSAKINSTDSALIEIKQSLQVEKTARESTTENLLIWGSLIFISLAIVVICSIVYLTKQKNKMRQLTEWSDKND